jgi:RNA polymerase sigma-70 factor, ECF subfamily
VAQQAALPNDDELDEKQEAELVKASAEGDPDAFQQLVQKYRSLVMRVAYRGMGDMALAEDVAQEAFLKVYRGLPSYRPDKPFVHWLRRVVANTVIDEVRRRRPAESLDDMEQQPPSEEEGPQEIADHHGLQQAVRDAILALPPRYRQVIVMQVFEEKTYEQMAQALGIPLGTVMWRLNKAKRLLRAQLGRLWEEAA